MKCQVFCILNVRYMLVKWASHFPIGITLPPLSGKLTTTYATSSIFKMIWNHFLCFGLKQNAKNINTKPGIVNKIELEYVFILYSPASYRYTLQITDKLYSCINLF